MSNEREKALLRKVRGRLQDMPIREGQQVCLGFVEELFELLESSPSCACEGREPLVGWRGWQHEDWRQALSSPRHPGKDCCHEVQVLVFALPAEEAA